MKDSFSRPAAFSVALHAAPSEARGFLTHLVSAAGFSAHEVTSTDELLRRQDDGGVVLLAHSNPVEALAVCRWLRSAGEASPILVACDRRRPEEWVQAWRAGADDILGRPFRLSELRSKLGSIERAAWRPTTLRERTRRPVLLASPFRSTLYRLGRRLHAAGQPTRLALRGADVLAQTGSGEVSAAVVSLCLRGPSGLDTVARLRERGPVDLPCLALAEEGVAPADRERALALTGTLPLDLTQLPAEAAAARVADLTRADPAVPHPPRASARLPCFIPVEFRWAEMEWTPAVTFDGGSGGAFLRSLAAPEPGTDIDLRVPGAPGGPTWPARVCWVKRHLEQTAGAHPVGMGVRWRPEAAP